MSDSKRVLQGSRTKGSTAMRTSLTSTSAQIDTMPQGVDIKTIRHLGSRPGGQARASSDNIVTLSGKDLSSKGPFDDTFTPTILSGSSVAFMKMDAAGRISQRVSHQYPDRDFGQSSLYDDGTIFQEFDNPDNGLLMIDTLDKTRVFPSSLLDHSSFTALDGRIDPLLSIRSIDRSTIDHPFNATGIRGNCFQGEDHLRNSFQVIDKYNLPSTEVATTAFLDAVEHLGPVDLPGVFNPSVTRILPFVDTDNDAARYADKNLLDSDVKSLYKKISYSTDNVLENFDKIGSGGYDHDGRVDSLAFGGLER